MNRSSMKFLALMILLQSCSHKKMKEEKRFKINTPDDYFTKVHETKCGPESKVTKYRVGDLVCTKNFIKVSSKEKIEIKFIITNKKSEDPYEYGYQELHRYKDDKIIEKIKLRKDDDAYWSLVPFVRIRKQKFLADLDNDGFLEFAVFPFHPGSAIWGTVRIFSLKDKIEFWGKGRYQFEGDTFVQLGCMNCSKFAPEECKKCH